MKKFIFGLLSGLIVSSCASVVIPLLDNRTLLIDQDSATLIYPYCAKKSGGFLGIGKDKCEERKTDRYDLTNATIRSALKSFVCVHEKRILQ